MIKWLFNFLIRNSQGQRKKSLMLRYCKRYGHTWDSWYPTGMGGKLRYCKRCPIHEEGKL